jgi:SAM-dependent methyltransferase
VLGLDLSTPMLARARERAAAAGLANTVLELGDAQVYAFEPGAWDVVFSRFGVMFFADPAAAFANLRAALRPDGRLAFVCWRALDENPWVRIPMLALAQQLPAPVPLDPHAPGPFAFADAARVRGILAAAGWSAIEIERADLELTIPGATVREATDFLLKVGPTGRAVREAGIRELAPLAKQLEAALAPHATRAGVRMQGSVWVVTARSRGD